VGSARDHVPCKPAVLVPAHDIAHSCSSLPAVPQPSYEDMYLRYVSGTYHLSPTRRQRVDIHRSCARVDKVHARLILRCAALRCVTSNQHMDRAGCSLPSERILLPYQRFGTGPKINTLIKELNQPLYGV